MERLSNIFAQLQEVSLPLLLGYGIGALAGFTTLVSGIFNGVSGFTNSVSYSLPYIL